MTREEALSLLYDGAAEKLTASGDLLGAREVFEEVARAGGALGALGSYRLGHVLLRLGALEDADLAFSRSTRARCLGPWPAVFRLAVAVSMDGVTDGHWATAVAALDRDPEEQLQSGAVNALEVLAAAVDPSRLQDLAGRGVLPGESAATWTFIRQPEGSRRQLSEAMARALTEDEDRLALVLGERSTANREPLPPALARTLALRLLHPEWPRRLLRSRLEVEADTFRQRLRQLRRRLPDALDDEGRPVVPTVAAVDGAFFSR